MEAENRLPPGFRFHPTDEELITYYLTPKVSERSFTSKAIVDVDLNKWEPWDLPGMHLNDFRVMYSCLHLRVCSLLIEPFLQSMVSLGFAFMCLD